MICCMTDIHGECRHNYVQCSCGRVAVDGGTDYLRCSYSGNQDEYTDLSGWAEIADKQKTVSRVYRLRWKDNPVLAEEAESEIVAYERTWGYDAYKFIEKYENVGVVEIYYAQDYRADQSGTGSERMDFVGTEVHRYPERIQNGEGSNPEAGRSGNVTEEGIFSTSPRFSLPSTDILNDQIARHQAEQNASQQDYGTGERQFAGQTIQNSTAVPDWIKQEFLKPEELNYEEDTNREQVEKKHRLSGRE